jgi:crotonobetainyl-CoA:carnitine CoA-transferase CaiB-like acyl-CoA transferase
MISEARRRISVALQNVVAQPIETNYPWLPTNRTKKSLALDLKNQQE